MKKSASDRGHELALALALALAGLASWAAPALAGDQTPEKQVIQMTLQKRPFEGDDNVGYGNCQWLEPFDRPQERLEALPEFKSKSPVFYAARFGDSPDNVFTLVIDQSAGTGTGYDVLYVDSNNDNRLDQEKERHGIVVGTPAKADPIYVEFQVSVGGKVASHFYHFAAFRYSDRKFKQENIHATLRNGSHRVGEAFLAGRRHRVALADLDSNGLFNNPEREVFAGDRFFVDLADLGWRDFGRYWASFAYGQYTLVAGQWYSIAATPDGSELTITTAQPRFGTIEAAAGVAKATLRSANQTLELQFTNRQARGIEGTYQARAVSLEERNPVGEPCRLRGHFPKKAPEVTIRQGERAVLTAGYPLSLQIAASPGEKERMVALNLVLIGAGGESYAWTKQANRTEAKPRFAVLDAQGKAVAEGEFEYG